ncbi:MAG: MFS transporter [Cellulomonas sp. 73-145]|nr:MAG: MFS transporter [Cellulomonas sp. 73-145]
MLLARRSRTGPVPRARLLLIGCYVLMGLMTSGWLARIPAVRDQLHLSTATLGALLLVGSVGALLTVMASGVVVQRIGSRRSLVLSTGVLGAGYALMGIGPGAGSAAVLAVGIFLNGVGVSLANMVFNLESARIERAMGRTVIPHFHAGFSVGAVAGSAGGALASRLGISVTAQLTAVAAVAVVWRLASVRGVVLDPVADELAAALRPVAGTSGGRLGSVLSAWTERRTVLIGVVVLAASLSEGSANTWLSLAVVDGFRKPESMGGVVLGLFVAAMTVVRLLGTRLIDRFGRVVVLRTSGLVSLVGLLTFGLAPSLPLACVGVVAWGFGAALAVPIGIAAASDDPRRAAARVALVSTFASGASIAAPPLLGLAAETMGARHMLLLVVVAMVASVSVSRQVARLRAPVPAAVPTARPAPTVELLAVVEPSVTGLPTAAAAVPEPAGSR